MIEEQRFKRKTAPCIYRTGSTQDFHMYPSVSLIVVCAYVECKATQQALVRMYKSTFHVSGHLTPLMKEVCCKCMHTCWVSPFSTLIERRIPAQMLPRGIVRKITDELCENPSASAWISASVCNEKSWNSSEKCKLSVSSTVHIYRVFSANQN